MLQIEERSKVEDNLETARVSAGSSSSRSLQCEDRSIQQCYILCVMLYSNALQSILHGGH